MSKYYGIFKMQFKGELQYRAKALSGIATQFFWGLMYIYLYTAFMSSSSVDGFTLSQMASYIWLGQSFFALRYMGMPKHASDEIVNGNVCYKFIRPINIYNQWYFEYLGEKLAATLLRFFPIIVISVLLPTNYGLSMAVSGSSFILFLISLFIGGMLCVSISMFSVYLTFVTQSPKGSAAVISTIAGLLGGSLIPIPLMPSSIQYALNFLPFRYISDLPFRIYIGNIGINDALIQIGISILWLAITILLGQLLIRKSLKKTVIQGG